MSRDKTPHSVMSPYNLQFKIEAHLEKIERLLGPHYKLTLIASHDGPENRPDADLLLTMATRDQILRTINRLQPPTGT